MENFPPLWQRKDTTEYIQRNKGDRWLSLQLGTTEKLLILHYSRPVCEGGSQAVMVHLPHVISQVVSPTTLLCKGHLEGLSVLARFCK